jgi:hypothetical protein
MLLADITISDEDVVAGMDLVVNVSAYFYGFLHSISFFILKMDFQKFQV